MSTMKDTDLSVYGESAVQFQVTSLIVYSGLSFSTLDSWLHLHESDIASCISITAEDTSQACVSLGKHSWCFCRTTVSPASLPTWVDFFLWKSKNNWQKSSWYSKIIAMSKTWYNLTSTLAIKAIIIKIVWLGQSVCWSKNRQIDQCNVAENSDKPHKYLWTILWQRSKEWRRDGLFHKWCW